MPVGNRNETGRRRGLLIPRRVPSVLAVTAALLAAALLQPVAASADTLTPAEKAQRRSIKQQYYGRQVNDDAGRIAVGAAQPVIDFTVVSSPPSMFVDYVIPDEAAAAFAASVPLPAGFTLAKVRIIESDPVARYWLSLNVYAVRGITSGLRAEWSTYVDDGTGTPRFMIIKARTGQFSLDPIGPLAFPEPFSHTLGSDDVLRTSMGRTQLLFGLIPRPAPGNLFTSTVALPAAEDRNYVVPTREWVEANDYIYWRNGVKDHAFHNAKAHSPSLISVDLSDVTIDDATPWVPYIEPTPAHVLVYLDALEFVIGPWWNVTEPDGHVPPYTQNRLFSLKNTMYSGLARLNALNVTFGLAEPTLRTTVDSGPPSVYWHWRIPDEEVANLQTALDLPPGLTLAPVRLQDDDSSAQHWLSLNVYKVAGATPGLRAVWSTFVDDGHGVRSLVVESRSSEAGLDPVNLYTAPYPLSHTFDADVVDTTVGSGPGAFASSFTVPPPGSRTTVLSSREWAAAKDLTYWTNGIADRVSYDGALLNAQLISVDPNTVAVPGAGPWAQYLDGAPDRVWVYPHGYDLITNPWWNLNRL